MRYRDALLLDEILRGDDLAPQELLKVPFSEDAGLVEDHSDGLRLYMWCEAVLR